MEGVQEVRANLRNRGSDCVSTSADHVHTLACCCWYAGVSWRVCWCSAIFHG